MKNCKSTNFLLFPGHKAGCECGNRRVGLTRVGGGSFNFRLQFGKKSGIQYNSRFQKATRSGLKKKKKKKRRGERRDDDSMTHHDHCVEHRRTRSESVGVQKSIETKDYTILNRTKQTIDYSIIYRQSQLEGSENVLNIQN